MHFLPVGKSGLLIELPDLTSALTSYATLREASLPGVIQLLPAARTVLVSFDSAQTNHDELATAIAALPTITPKESSGNTTEIPVEYNGEDLDEVAHILGVSKQTVINRHTSHPWLVAFSGFAPGFSYLSDGDPLFDVPRKSSPRISVPAGSVGLAGAFSGIYPRVSSGGWQLIGTTAIQLWDDERNPPALLQAGDYVRFVPVKAQAILQDSIRETPPPDSQQHASLAKQPLASKTNSNSSISLLQVLQTGILSTIQDEGRSAVNMGVNSSGAMDRFSFHLANELVGNSLDAAAIEITGGNAVFAAKDNLVIAITGAPVSVSICSAADETITLADISCQQAFVLRSGELVKIATPHSGLRNYLAVQGGFESTQILNSASTDTMSHIGPLPLSSGDNLTAGSQTHHSISPPLSWSDMPRPNQITELPVTLGPRDDWFTQRGLDTLFQQPWEVTAQSNRVGIRLQGDEALERSNHSELPSEGTIPGAIQVPNNGQPVIFMRDHPVTGGYPVVAILDAEAINIAAQLPPHALVRFVHHTDSNQKEL
ncbi:5-oxoprolinase/urea amidolyase family protein [Bifidobacterium sp.]|jgi:KipI family sensor histidine kinase inhibitor|uniref:5-oxoprolinase subunit B/C family protein n=1 Tax=Bifidobacterium sp. TaxID=41200 RepID=UPI0025C1A69C|nr:5-oxoprolinase/urea amidolyase family protein [Bifidobacterium sp.]MCI1635947.1 5-oxoprolinase/urea amidolyase family protein [Bifidobacterium sp.]